ncbi:MAG: amidohydrolase family protein [Actinobacteria bacterium]|nr:amidohydrolase family protein [Actinomycetota bacterium]
MTLVVRAPQAWLGPGRLVRDAEIVCEGGEIVAAGPRGSRGSRSAPAGEPEVLEIDGFVMPAAADRHVHIALSDPASVLLRGVTAVRDLAWPPERIFPLADASELPTYTGPLVRAAGPMLTGPGGYPTQDGWAPPGTGRELRGPDDARAVVKELASLGAAAIKVSLNAEAGPTPSDGELAAICEVAHELDLPVTAHAQGRGEVERALGAGVDELAHTPWTERLSDDVVQTAAKRMRIVSTLDILSRGRDTPEIRIALDNLRRFHAAGGAVIYGTDLGNGAIPPGIHVREALLLAEAGLEFEEVLEAMVRAPLEPGAPADLLAFARSPLDDLGALDDLRLVVRAGAVVLLR